MCAFRENARSLHFLYDRENANMITTFRMPWQRCIALPLDIHISGQENFNATKTLTAGISETRTALKKEMKNTNANGGNSNRSMKDDDDHASSGFIEV